MTVKSFAVNEILELEGAIHPGDYVWDEAGVPGGATRIVVDLAAQLLYVYRAGREIGRTSIIYGDEKKPTPLGIFPIIEKDADHYSRTYWGAPMPHMLKLTGDGISIHGAAKIDPDYATHGCVGVPEEFARILFSEAGLGDYVLITKDWKPA